MSNNLIGETLIELTDSNGKVESYVDKNIVTNGLATWLSMPGRIRELQSLWRSNFYDNVFNLRIHSDSELSSILDLLGGISLFENPIEENVDNIVMPDGFDNPLTGCANNFANGSSYPKRGSLNYAESGFIEDGIRLVWEFSSAQANGPISCVCLTPPQFSYNGNDMFPFHAVAGYARSSEVSPPQYPRLESSYAPWLAYSSNPGGLDGGGYRAGLSKYLQYGYPTDIGEDAPKIWDMTYRHFAGIDRSNLHMPRVLCARVDKTTASNPAEYAVYLHEQPILLDAFDIFNGGRMNGRYQKPEPMQTIKFTTSIIEYNYTTTDFGNVIYCGDNKFLFFYRTQSTYPNASRQGSSTFALVLFDKNSGKIWEKTLILDVWMKSVCFASLEKDIMILQGTKYVSSAMPAAIQFIAVKMSNISEITRIPVLHPSTDDEIFCYGGSSYSDSETSVYRLGQIAENTFLAQQSRYGLDWAPFTKLFDPDFDYTAQYSPIGGYKFYIPTGEPSECRIYPSLGIVITEPSYFNGYPQSVDFFHLESGITFGLCLLHASTSSGNISYRYPGSTSNQSNSCYIAMYATPRPLLFTINNLATPITKTPDKTMKITYILRKANSDE